MAITAVSALSVAEQKHLLHLYAALHIQNYQWDQNVWQTARTSLGVSPDISPQPDFAFMAQLVMDVMDGKPAPLTDAEQQTVREYANTGQEPGLSGLDKSQNSKFWRQDHIRQALRQQGGFMPPLIKDEIKLITREFFCQFVAKTSNPPLAQQLSDVSLTYWRDQTSRQRLLDRIIQISPQQSDVFESFLPKKEEWDIQGIAKAWIQSCYVDGKLQKRGNARETSRLTGLTEESMKHLLRREDLKKMVAESDPLAAKLLPLPKGETASVMAEKRQRYIDLRAQGLTQEQASVELGYEPRACKKWEVSKGFDADFMKAKEKYSQTSRMQTLFLNKVMSDWNEKGIFEPFYSQHRMQGITYQTPLTLSQMHSVLRRMNNSVVKSQLSRSTDVFGALIEQLVAEQYQYESQQLVRKVLATGDCLQKKHNIPQYIMLDADFVNNSWGGYVLLNQEGLFVKKHQTIYRSYIDQVLKPQQVLQQPELLSGPVKQTRYQMVSEIGQILSRNNQLQWVVRNSQHLSDIAQQMFRWSRLTLMQRFPDMAIDLSGSLQHLLTSGQKLNKIIEKTYWPTLSLNAETANLMSIRNFQDLPDHQVGMAMVIEKIALNKQARQHITINKQALFDHQLSDDDAKRVDEFHDLPWAYKKSVIGGITNGNWRDRLHYILFNEFPYAYGQTKHGRDLVAEYVGRGLEKLEQADQKISQMLGKKRAPLTDEQKEILSQLSDSYQQRRQQLTGLISGTHQMDQHAVIIPARIQVAIQKQQNDR